LTTLNSANEVAPLVDPGRKEVAENLLPTEIKSRSEFGSFSLVQNLYAAAN